MDTLTACSVLWALASGGQAALLDAALPHIPYRSSEEVTVSPNADSAAMRPVSSVAASLGRTMISWPQYRRLGVGLWLTDPPAVQGAAEALAKAQYSRNKDPYDCMLMYIALGKRAMLINLFRQANNRKVRGHDVFVYDCMLMYIARGKRAMLINLFRQANNNKVRGHDVFVYHCMLMYMA
eukprot:gene19172-25781_t